MNRYDIYTVCNLVGLGEYPHEFQELIDKQNTLYHQIDEFEQGELDILLIEQKKNQLESLEELIDEITTFPLVYVNLTDIQVFFGLKFDDVYDLLKQATFHFCLVDVIPLQKLKEAISNIADVEDYLFDIYFQHFKVE